MDYLPISDNAARQVIDASTIFEEWRRADKEARPYVGGMYWKRQGEYEYLVKTLPDKRQTASAPALPRQKQYLMISQGARPQ